MNRPLVWLGIAYAVGEGIAAAGAGAPVTFVLAFAALIFIYKGRNRKLKNVSAFAYVLPFFFVLGSCLFSSACRVPGEDIFTGQEDPVRFCGRVSRVQETEKSLALTLQRARVCQLSCSSREETVCGIVIYADKEEGNIEEGAMIEGQGEMSRPQAPSNPGQFDMRLWYQAQGIHYTLMPSGIRVLSRSLTWKSLLGRLRKAMAAAFSRIFAPDEAGILDAMILGERTLLSEDVQELFREMGISHILAISGLHISLIGQGLYRAFRKGGMGFRPAAVLSAFMVLSYGSLSGMSPSTQRAVIMFLVRMGGEYLGRTSDMPSSLALSALIILVRRPLMITQSGLQFSFSALIAVCALKPALSLLMERAGLTGQRGSRREKLMENVSAPVSILIMTLPLTALYYGEIPLLSLPMNLLILPSMSLLVPMGALSGLIGLILPGAARFPGGSAHAILKMSLFACRLAEKIPFALARTGVPPAGLLIAYYGALICLMLSALFIDRKASGGGSSSLPPGRLAGLPLLYLAVMILLILVPFRRFSCFAEYLDVGQGDCIFLRSPRATWLIDRGSSSVKNVGTYRIIPFLTYYGEEKVDYVLASHSDEDHISGIRELLQEGCVRNLVLTRAGTGDEKYMQLAALAREKGTDVIFIEKGSSWRDGRWKFTCLYPGRDLEADNANDLSMVVRVDAGDLGMLFTGDISSRAEEQILSSCRPEDLAGIDILKCAHHGSRTSSCSQFLARVSPRAAVISCGLDNRYGHPSPQTVLRLKQAGVRIYYTMKSGALKVSPGKRPRLTPFRSEKDPDHPPLDSESAQK